MSEAYCDGGYSPATGRGMWCFFYQGKPYHGVIKESEYGNLTSNVMEYIAVLNLVRFLPSNAHVDILSDSQLVMRQLSGDWKLHYDHLRELANEVERIIRQKRIKVSFKWIPRDDNPAGHFIEIHGKQFISKKYRQYSGRKIKQAHKPSDYCPWRD